MARAGICSRRQAEEYIRQGRISVDGQIVTQVGTKVDPRRQKIYCDQRPVPAAPKKIYLLLNKPKGYLTTLKDPQGRPIVTSLLKNIEKRLFPVGRLDLDTEGALLMTNYGELAQKVLHPSFEVKKTYLAIINGKISKNKLQALENGIELDGKKTWPAILEVMDSKHGQTKIKIIIHEGRKRQVRRMFAAIGHRVIHLKRLAYGNLHLGNLAVGKYRFLNKNDLDKLFSKKISFTKNKKLYNIKQLAL